MPVISGESTHNAFRLTSEILALSVADTWDDAKAEWSLADVFYADREDPGTCLCGHFPIIENCRLVNRINGNRAIVGNVCVKKFLGLDSGTIFDSINRVRQDNTRALNAATIQHAFAQDVIDPWQIRFYMQTLRKRKLTPKQRVKRIEINQQILAWVEGGGN